MFTFRKLSACFRIFIKENVNFSCPFKNASVFFSLPSFKSSHNFVLRNERPLFKATFHSRFRLYNYTKLFTYYLSGNQTHKWLFFEEFSVDSRNASAKTY